MKTNADQKAYAEWYGNTQARINTIVGGSYSSHWNAIKQARQDWLDTISDPHTGDPTFPVWLQDKYGIKLIQLDSGLSTDFDVVDESKYIMFLLKYK